MFVSDYSILVLRLTRSGCGLRRADATTFTTKPRSSNSIGIKNENGKKRFLQVDASGEWKTYFGSSRASSRHELAIPVVT